MGLLITGSSDVTMNTLRDLMAKERPSRIISVGDAVSKNMIIHNFPVDVLVVDNKVMRKPIDPILAEVDQTLYLKNPPGTLSEEAWVIIKEALSGEVRTRVLVDGEEDLLTLVAVLCAPDNSVVVYGQPHEGIVVVKVTRKTRKKARQFVSEMENAFEKLK